MSLPAPCLAVLDTNVWLDLLVFGEPGVAPLQAALASGRLLAQVDDRALAELERVLAYPLGRHSLSEDDRPRVLERCRAQAHHFRGTSLASAVLPACRDPHDQSFLELARDAGAHCLVTRDRDLLVLARRGARPLPFAILTPGAAIAALAA